MIDQELLSEPTNGDDSTFTADSRSEHDDQTETAERIRVALQPRTTSAARMLADSVAASNLGRWAQELTEQNDRMAASLIGLNSASAALANYTSPLADAAERMRAAVQPKLPAINMFTDQSAATGLGRWAADMAKQNDRMMASLTGVNSASAALANYTLPLADAAERMRAAVQPKLPAINMFTDQSTATGLGRWAADMAEQHKSLLSGVIGAIPDHRGPLVDATQWIQNTLRPTELSWAGFLPQSTDSWTGFLQQITDSLSRIVPESLLEFGRQAAQAARALRERLYFALLAAQDAAMRGDKSAVAAFFEEWAALPRSKPSGRMQAAMDALIAAPLDESDPDLAFATLKDVRLDAKRRFERGRRPLGETMIGGQAIGSLDADPRKLTDVFSIRCAGGSVEERTFLRLNYQVGDQVDDQRLVAVITGMTQQEQQVIWAYGFLGETWEGAAARLGLPASEGERIRAKAQRRADSESRKKLLSRPTLLGR